MSTIYMKIDGIDGNVTAKGFEKCIELLATDFGLGRSITSHEGGSQSNRGVNAPSFSELRISKKVDETSPKLFLESCLGQGKTVVIHFVETAPGVQTGTGLRSYLDITLSDVLLSSFAFGGNGGGGSPTEKMTLNFSKIQVGYTPYKQDGTPGTPIRTAYDLAQATPVAAA